MNQVLLYLSFWNTEHPSQLIGRHPGIGQKIDDALTRGLFGKQHACMVKTGSKKSQMIRTGFLRIILSLAYLKVAPTLPFCQNPFLHLIATSRLTHWAGLSSYPEILGS